VKEYAVVWCDVWMCCSVVMVLNRVAWYGCRRLCERERRKGGGSEKSWEIKHRAMMRERDSQFPGAEQV
jgi:hypothetical protein